MERQASSIALKSRDRREAVNWNFKASAIKFRCSICLNSDREPVIAIKFRQWTYAGTQNILECSPGFRQLQTDFAYESSRYLECPEEYLSRLNHSIGTNNEDAAHTLASASDLAWLVSLWTMTCCALQLSHLPLVQDCCLQTGDRRTDVCTCSYQISLTTNFGFQRQLRSRSRTNFNLQPPIGPPHVRLALTRHHLYPVQKRNKILALVRKIIRQLRPLPQIAAASSRWLQFACVLALVYDIPDSNNKTDTHAQTAKIYFVF